MRFINHLFNIVFFLQFFLYSVIFIFILAFYLIIPIPFCDSQKNKSRTRNTIKIYGKWILHLAIYPYVRVIYKDYSNNSSIPGIFISNHRSASDPYLMALLNTELVQIVNKWPFKIPFYGYFAKKAEYISVHDLTYDELLTECSNQLSNGVAIAAFPEGTRSGNSTVGTFNGSMFRVAIENKCPIYPICIIGNEAIPARNFSVKPGKIIVHKLKPLLWNDYKNMSAFHLKKHVRNIIITETAKMERLKVNA
jgi:1-acyl-sn-glycerol-3-phosphate acyltransferase